MCILMISSGNLQRIFIVCLLFITQLLRILYQVLCTPIFHMHYSDVIMSPIAYKITVVSIVCAIVDSDEDQRKHKSSASLDFVRGIHRRPVNFPHKGPVTWKMSSFDDVIMTNLTLSNCNNPLLLIRDSNDRLLCYPQNCLEKISTTSCRPSQSTKWQYTSIGISL